MHDPFATLGVPATMDLDDARLEARYLELSRSVHPDHAGDDVDAQLAALARSAELNDAYRDLRDPWQRARILCERMQPGANDATARLDPEFLLDAMQLAETVAECGDAERPELAANIEARLAAHLRDIQSALARSDAMTAARLLHEARYWQKARADLRGRRHP